VSFLILRPEINGAAAAVASRKSKASDNSLQADKSKEASIRPVGDGLFLLLLPVPNWSLANTCLTIARRMAFFCHTLDSVC